MQIDINNCIMSVLFDVSEGPTVGEFCMNIAIQKAKTVGVGWVVVKGRSFHEIVIISFTST